MDRMINRMVILCVSWVFLGIIMSSTKAPGAESPKEFYRGKTIRWIVASEPGSPTDLITRTIAPFLASEIGAKVRIEDRKGDEGINFAYKQGSRDGLTLAVKTNASIIGNEILKAPGVQYETDKFNFVADVFPSVKVFQISPKLPYKTLDALRKAKGLRGGGTTTKGDLALSSAVMFEVLGLDGKVITGYEGKKNLTLGMARGEVDFMCTSDSMAMKDEEDGYAINMMTAGDKRSAAVPNVPTLSELGVKVSKEMETVHKFVSSGGTAVALPPGVAQERIEYMRKVFQRLSSNQNLQKAMEKLTGMRTAFAPGQELQQDMAQIKADKEMVNKLDAIFKKYTAVR